LLLAGLLTACATTSPKPEAPASPAAAAPAVSPEADLMTKLLGAQFALQDNDLEGGAKGFAEAAALSRDPDVAEEATRLALAVKDWTLAKTSLVRWHALAPEDPGPIQARAWIAIGEGRTEEAYADLDKLAARGDTQSWRLVSQALLVAEDKTAASRLLDRLATPAHLGDNEPIWIAVSQLAYKLGDKASAQRIADGAIDRFHSSDGYAWSARLAVDRGEKVKARALYAEALKRDPKSVRLRGGYAALLADGGDNAGAARVLSQGPQDDTTLAARAAYAARADDKAALAALYHELDTDKSSRDGGRLFLLGQVAELLDKREDALTWYREIGEDDEHWFDAQTREAIVLDQLGRTDQSLEFLRQLQAQTVEDSTQLGNVYLLEADLLARKGRVQDANAVYERGLETLPDDPRLLYARALLAAEQNDVSAAERDLRRVIELKPDDADALNALGYTLADRTDRRAEALELIERAIKLKPDEPAIIDSLGWIRYRMGDLDASLKELRRAYEKQADPEIAAHLGEVLWVKGERDEARRVWEQGRKKDAKNKALLETIRRLTT
ncbi:MAG TPA: tetratricopeptide repeat protein, partial [Rhodanobacteraceae bacterium]